MDIYPSLPRAVRSLAVLGACVGAARPAAPAHATAVAPAPLVTAVVDAGKTSAPINPDLYGMFIEHAGGLVYRGLWAELIDDRKFFNPITNDATEAQPAPRGPFGGPPRPFGGPPRNFASAEPAREEQRRRQARPERKNDKRKSPGRPKEEERERGKWRWDGNDDY